MPSKILVVDDELSMLELLSISISEAYPHYEVIEAINGTDGLEKFQEHATDIRCVLSDNFMPKMNGTEMLKKIISTGFSGKIIMMSGEVDSTINRLQELEIFERTSRIFEKPFDISELMDFIQKNVS